MLQCVNSYRKGNGKIDLKEGHGWICMYITVFNIPYQRNSLLNVCVSSKKRRVVQRDISKRAFQQQQSELGVSLHRLGLSAYPSPGAG